MSVERLEIPNQPASLWFVGLPRATNQAQLLFSVPNRRASDTGEFSWPDMSTAERGALRSLCIEALSILARMEAEP